MIELGDAPAQGTIALIVVTALIGALIGVFGKRAAEFLLEGLLRPLRWGWESIYRWVAPRNPFSLSLRSYKKHIRRSWLTKIENPIGPDLDVPLEHAFAPLKLISSTSQETIDLFTHISANHRCVVLGGPGTGKTTLMKSLVTSVVNHQANPTLNSLIPVFVVLRKLAVRQHSVKEAIVAAFTDFHFPGSDRFVDSALKQGKMLIILDGLDEVGVNREYVAGQIIKFCEADDQQINKNHLVVTCREYSYQREDLRSVIRNVVRVEPFANHHMRVFLQGWPSYKGRSALRLFSLIQGDSQIRDICRNPLLLTILTGLYLETQEFELPTSRNLFYKAAIDELITKRPARREIRQQFDSADKWQVLQRVSLQRLEAVHKDEDLEELTIEAFREQATAVFRKEVNFADLIRELVEVNGIIKPGSEGVYTCAHRTIQEYLAANEAGRIRTPNAVIERFSNRQDLIEVLYFYCGMLTNVPQLTEIVDAFIRQDRWIDAARCLLNMQEVPPSSYVEKVTTELGKQVREGSEFKPVLEILSSLAQRKQPEFDLARKRFIESVNHLAGGDQVGGASALESALATSPGAAMRVIPGLLRHESTRWQTTAVQLLRDIGTDESLDQLVHLLTSDNEFVRAQAGKALAGLIQTRNQDLKARSSLLPDRQDKVIWPLDRIFPAKLAIPIAESVVHLPHSGNDAIDCAVRAIRLRKKGNPERRGQRFLRSWQNVLRDRTLGAIRLKLGSVLRLMAFATPIALLALLSLASMTIPDEIMVFEVNQPNIITIEKESVQVLEQTAHQIVAEIESTHPANAAGLSRALPWNWLVEPVIPEKYVKGFETLKQRLGSNPYEWSRDAETFETLTPIVSPPKMETFKNALSTLEQKLPTLQSSYYLIVRDELAALMGAVIAFFASISIWRVFGKQASRREWGVFRHSLLTGFVIFGFQLWVSFPTGGGVKTVCLFLYIACGILWLFGGIITKFSWPKNEFVAVITDLLPKKTESTMEPRRIYEYFR